MTKAYIISGFELFVLVILVLTVRLLGYNVGGAIDQSIIEFVGFACDNGIKTSIQQAASHQFNPPSSQLTPYSSHLLIIAPALP